MAGEAKTWNPGKAQDGRHCKDDSCFVAFVLQSETQLKLYLGFCWQGFCLDYPGK